MRWPGISERMWLETISCASCCSDEGRVCVTINSSARQTANAPDTAVVNQFQAQTCRCGTAFAGEGNSDLIRCRNSAGAVKYSASDFSVFFKLCRLRQASAHAEQPSRCCSNSRIAADSNSPSAYGSMSGLACWQFIIGLQD